MSLTKHPHVVGFKEVFLTPKYLAVVVEYIEGETLQVMLCSCAAAVPLYCLSACGGIQGGRPCT